jgi:hypothetical protein
MNRLFAAALALGLTVAATCSRPSGSSISSGWNRDLDFFISNVRQQHYIYSRKPVPERFEAATRKLRSRLNGISGERAMAEFQRLAALLGDGHTYVLPWGSDRITSTALPVRLYEFSDGMFVTDARNGHEHLIGAQLVRIGGEDATLLMKEMASVVSRDNDMGVKWIGPILLSFRGFLEALLDRPMGEAVQVEFVLPDGSRKTIELPFLPFPPMRGLPKLTPPPGVAAPRYLSRVQDECWLEELQTDGKRILYVQVNQSSDGALGTQRELAERLRSLLGPRRHGAVIVDVRHNNGGSAELMEPLTQVLVEYDRSPDARLFVLTSRNTFSAAQIFISNLDRVTAAVFAGEPSSSKPNFVGEENVIKLPWSGTLASISNRYHETIAGDQRRWIEPLIRVDLRSTDHFSGIDPVLEAVLRHLSTAQ